MSQRQVDHLPLTFFPLFDTCFLHSSQYHLTIIETIVSHDPSKHTDAQL